MDTLIKEQREAILSNFKDRGGSGVSYIELTRGMEPGEYNMHHPEIITIVFWTKLTEEFIQALIGLLVDEVLRMTSCSELIYMHDGRCIDLPIANKLNYEYKEPRWAPLVFNKGKNYEK